MQLNPTADFLPKDWRFEDADPQLRAVATAGDDPFTFGDLFTQMLHVHLRVTHRGVPVASDSMWIERSAAKCKTSHARVVFFFRQRTGDTPNCAMNQRVNDPGVA